MNRADFLISTELLRKVLEFPEGVTIIGRSDGNLLMTVESDLIPDNTPEVLPTWRKTDDVTEFLRFEPCNLPAVPRGEES